MEEKYAATEQEISEVTLSGCIPLAIKGLVLSRLACILTVG